MRRGGAQPRDNSQVSCSELVWKTAVSPQFGKKYFIFNSLVWAAGTRSAPEIRPSHHLLEALVEQSSPSEAFVNQNPTLHDCLCALVVPIGERIPKQT